MVVKLKLSDFMTAVGFESRVILDGSQTLCGIHNFILRFESRVILDGSQTQHHLQQQQK